MTDIDAPAGMSDGPTATTAKAGPMLAADGTTLRSSLRRAERRQKVRALALIAPLLIFVLAAFVAPIADMLFRSVENGIVPETLPRTTAALEARAGDADVVPGEEVFADLYTDLVIAEEYKAHTRLGSRLNYERSGMSSLFRGSGRDVGRFGTDIYADQFTALDATLADPAQWTAWAENDDIRDALPLAFDAWDAWATLTVDVNEDDPLEEDVPDFVFTALYRDLAAGAAPPAPFPSPDVSGFETLSLRDAFAEADDDWVAPATWETLELYSGEYTSGYFLNAVDLRNGPDGPELRPERERIYITLFIRTLWMSLLITGSCILLGYPVAWLIASLPARSGNMLLILVLLPFWTSLLVRTSAWKVLLQTQGVINDTLVWWHSTWAGWALDPLFTGICNIVIAVLKALALVYNLIFNGIFGAEAMATLDWAGLGFERLELINNVTGTIIAMTHILLPFMILPLYSVMKGIPPSYVRAAKSLGATDWTAFWRVYFPQSVPGIGAGSILVFILSIGYYITPEIVGGTRGVFISNRIAYHISDSLNWGLAAALGAILLVVVMTFYWLYDRIVGIDNVKLGG